MKGFKLALAVLAVSVLAMGCAKQTTKSTAKEKLQKIHFDFDQSNIKAEYEDELKGNAGWMNKNSKAKVTVEGHCDERGTNEYNIALGDRRVKSAQKYLNNLGVGKDKLSTISYGEEKSACSGHDESCWWQNRRAEFLAK